jgi:hypothetical protein
VTGASTWFIPNVGITSSIAGVMQQFTFRKRKKKPDGSVKKTDVAGMMWQFRKI